MRAIIENTNEIAFAINQILGEGIDDVEQRIASDFAQTGGDNYEIVNPYTEDMVSNTNAFIGQYCAAQGRGLGETSPWPTWSRPCGRR